ncbi:hypothetical protein K440DRAFT_621231 [Wilcoxina mikolae CBS 423.85]|nr:hypothetical protein K440DRAFT_621231 [Wilcoxina mikolae CBS 423.85]
MSPTSSRKRPKTLAIPTISEVFPASYPPGAAPKPNTRFLRNIVRDVDSHNAALLAKEAAEAQARLRRLQREQDGRLSRSPSPGRIRRWQYKDDNSRSISPEPVRHSHHRHRRRSRRSRSRSRSHGRHGSSRTERHDTDRRKIRRSRSGSSERVRHSHHRRHKDSERGRSKRSRSGSRHERDSGRYKDHEERKHRKRKRSRSKAGDDDGTTGKSERRGRQYDRRKQLEENDDDHSDKLDSPGSPSSAFSDPLDEIIGPAPPPKPRTRGRGATGQAAMDSRFQSDYDPMMDVRLDSDDQCDFDDFDDALEAYRDRQKWKQQGAERLRKAGLGEDFIEAWKNNDIKNKANLKWAKKGSTREWDRGKTLDVDDADGGGIDLRADWIKKGSTRECDKGKNIG